MTKGNRTTVFLPTDDAFAALPAERQTAIMQDPRLLREFAECQIVAGRISATDLLYTDGVTTINGKTLTLGKRDHPRIGSAEIIKTDVAENGVVHFIDAVL